MTRRIKKILIANRGEIALRVIRTCKELDIETVAIYSDADKWSHYISQADESYNIGPSPSTESYLRMDKIISIAKAPRCDAIHPGYGFLAENPAFANECRKNGITFIGPSANTIKAIGNKINARKLAEQNGIPVIPGIVISSTDVRNIRKFVNKNKVSYPLIVKASAGGGGKGMRIVNSENEMEHSIREASSEAKSAFGDPTIFIEKYLCKPRHIEIQILADNFGNVVHLGERECSIQRRHQKLLEESPSTFVDSDLRKKICETAEKLARLSRYTGAGTVEFLVDEKKNFYFLEVNTRLQVEHPVTEMITGIDIVKEQIMIADGRRLSFKQEDVKFSGHAIECRILAEDPFNNFIPSTGDIVNVRYPAGPFTRIDTDITTGSKITIYYDSLLAKLIVWGEDRHTAIKRMLRALKELKIVGIPTTIPFHINLLQCKEFLNGDIHTKFIEEKGHLILKDTNKKHLLDEVLIASALENHRQMFSTPQHKIDRKEISKWKQGISENINQE